MSKSNKTLQVRIDEYAFGVWFNVIDDHIYGNAVTIIDGFNKTQTFIDYGSFQYREVKVTE